MKSTPRRARTTSTGTQAVGLASLGIVTVLLGGNPLPPSPSLSSPVSTPTGRTLARDPRASGSEPCRAVETPLPTAALPVDEASTIVAGAVRTPETPAQPDARAIFDELLPNSVEISPLGLAAAARTIADLAAAMTGRVDLARLALARLDDPRSPREWMILAAALGQVNWGQASRELLERYERQTDPVRKGFLAAAIAQEKDPSLFARAYEPAWLSSIPFTGAGDIRDLSNLAPLLVSSSRPDGPARDRFLADLARTRDESLATLLTQALAASVEGDPEIRRVFLRRASGSSSSGPSLAAARAISDAAAHEPANRELVQDALDLLERAPLDEVRRAVALRLALADDREVNANLLERLQDPSESPSVREAILVGLGTRRPAFDEPFARAIREIALGAESAQVRRRAVACMAAVRGWPPGEFEILHASLLGDPAPQIRAEAILNVTRRRPTPALEPGVQALAQSDPDPSVRNLAFASRKSLQPAAPEFIE